MQSSPPIILSLILYLHLYYDRPAFKKDGTVTAANSSKLSDGGCAFILMSENHAKELGLKPLFKVRGFGDAARDPVEFTIGMLCPIYVFMITYIFISKYLLLLYYSVPYSSVRRSSSSANSCRTKGIGYRVS